MMDLYDPRTALPPGFVLTRDFETALFAAYANAGAPLTQAQAITACGTPPAYPTSLRRMEGV